MVYPKFSAALFDLDGTLSDSGPSHRRAEQAALKAFGVGQIAEDHPDTFGFGIERGLQMVASHYGIASPEDLFNEYVRQWEIVAANGFDLMPGAETVVRNVTNSGIKTALVTSGERPYADGFLRMTGFDKVFSTSITIEDVENSKPHPEPYLKAAEILGASPAKCIVFEDSVPGFLSARAAGMTCIGVGEIALNAEGVEAPDMAIASFVGFDITSVRPF